MKNYFKIIIFLGIVIGIVLISNWTTFSGKVNQLFFQKEITPPGENIEQKVFLVIDDGGGLPRSLEAEFKEGMTAFDLLKNETEKINMNLKTKTYDIGIFVEAIGDKENGQGSRYWLYYVNGQMPQVAADKEAINVGDKVEFKFEASPF